MSTQSTLTTNAKRPLTGWADRYVRAHMSLLTEPQVQEWLDAFDTMTPLLMQYITTHFFVAASVKKQKTLLTEFMALWNLPFGEALIQLLNHYQRLNDFLHFVDTWKSPFQG